MTELPFTDRETANINEQLPLFIRQDARTLVLFLEEYYKYLNQPFQGPSYVLSRIIEEHDIDEIVDPTYLDRLKTEIATSVPDSPYVIKSFLFKRIVEYYNVRGSTEAIQYFFRIFFNDDITIYYPWERVLIPSQSGWSAPVKLRIVGPDGLKFLGKTVYQPATKAQAFVSAVFEKHYADETIYDLIIKENTIRRSFKSQYDVTTLEDDNLSGTVYKSLSAITIENPGSGYVVGDTIKIPELESGTFKAVIDLVDDNGGVKKIRIVEYGSGNTINPTSVQLVNFNFSGYVEYNGDDVEYEESLVILVINANKIEVTTLNGSNLVLKLQFGAVIKTDGTYRSDKSQPSSTSAVLQDSFYHQKFSYEITSDVPYSDWKEAFRDFVHPAGTMMFSSIRNESRFNDFSEYLLDVGVEIPDVLRVDVTEDIELTNELDIYAQNYFAHAESSTSSEYNRFNQVFDEPYVVIDNTRNVISDTINNNTTTEVFDASGQQGFQ